MITCFSDKAYDRGVIGATAFFAFAAFGVYAADLFFRFQEWKSSGGEIPEIPWKNKNTNAGSNIQSPQGQTTDPMGPV